MDIIKAIVVGVAASAPIGPIAILVIQKTLSKGFEPGFITSLGATVVDTIFAIVAIFALAYVQSFIEGNSIPILIGGGIIVIAMGVSMALSDPFRKMKNETEDTPSSVSPADFLTACAMGFSNPGAIAVMFALMAFFGIAEERSSDWTCFPIILGIAGGSVLYWLSVTSLLNIFRKQFNMRTIIWINRVAGAVVIIVGLATLADGIMKIFTR
ncbi:MAG: LysE family translocator [Bacteroidales bacterium]|nr:LysE family translocator [Bacteroidales bacterium]